MVDADLRLLGNDGLGVERHSSAASCSIPRSLAPSPTAMTSAGRDPEPFRNVDERVDLGLLPRIGRATSPVSFAVSSRRIWHGFRRIQASLR